MPRPEKLDGITYKTRGGCGNLYITITYSEKNIIEEIFIRSGKAGGCASAFMEAFGRILSVSTETKSDTKRIIKTLKGIVCQQTTDVNPCCITAIALTIEKHIGQKEKPKPMEG